MPISETLNLDLPSQYKIHELIFINSGASYYTRLPVNEHAALLADNNQGKTSTLSAMKLFLLPEISFKRTAEKFGFNSGGVAYSDHDSYRYYFPSNESYIICHAQNPKLNFCWVLFRTADLEYERIAVPRAYDEIEHLFWKRASDKNGGAGELRPEISIATIRKKLLSEFDGKLFNDRGNIAEAIYTRTSIQDDNTRFSMLPMTKKATSSSVETVRSLLTMAFDLGNASTVSLPAAISSIIDGQGMSAVKSEGVFIDLDTQMDEWNDLKKQDAHISNVEANRPTYDSLIENKQGYDNVIGEVLPNHARLRATVDACVSKVSESLKDANKSLLEAEGLYKTQSAEHTALVGQSRTAAQRHKALTQSISKYSEDLKEADDARAQLRPVIGSDNPTDMDYLAYLDSDIEECKKDLDAIQNQGRAAEQLKDLHPKLQLQERSIEGLYQTIRDLEKGGTLLDQLPSKAGQVLDSLNNDFAALKGTLGVEQLAVINNFADLFEAEGETLLFCGQQMASSKVRVWDKSEAIKRIKAGLVEAEAQFDADNSRVIKLQESLELTDEERLTELAKQRDDLAGLKKQRNSLAGYEKVRELRADAETEAEEAVMMKAVLDEKVQVSSEKLIDLRERFERLQEEPGKLTARASSLNLCHSQIQNIEDFSHGLLVGPEGAYDGDPDADPLALQEELTALAGAMRELNVLRDGFRNDIRLLLDKGVVNISPEDKHATTTNDETFDAYFNQLTSLYSNLDSFKENYLQRLNAHNNTAATSTRMIGNLQGIIEKFTENINQEIEGYRVSNLDGVKLNVKLDAQYLSLIDSLAKMTTIEGALLSEEFYKQISSFQQRFYIRKTGKIDFSAIIEKINYHYKVHGEWEDKPQSNGTNSMVSAMLLALLFKRMIPEDLALSIPVIFDEAGKLDEKNLSEVLRLVDDHGLTLFAANPENTGTIAEVLGVYHDLASYKTVDVNVVGKCEIIYYAGMEDRLEDALLESEPEMVAS